MTSKRLRRPVGCGVCGKRSYKTRGDALRFLRDVLLLRTTPHVDPVNLEAYRCPIGNGFHIGHRLRSRFKWITGRSFDNRPVDMLR